MRNLCFGLLMIAVCLMSTWVLAQAPIPPSPNENNFFTDLPSDDLATRLEALEEAWEKHQESLSESKKKAAEEKLQKELEAKKKPTFKMGGRIHADAWTFPESDPGIGFFEHPTGPLAGQDPEDRFAFRRIRMEFQGDILESMFWRMQVDFADPATPNFKDVYVGFEDIFGQDLIVGNQKRPLGLDHWNSSRFNIFLERPMVIEAFNSDARRLGLAMHGNSEDESVNWVYGIFNEENIQNDGTYLGDHWQLCVNGRLTTSPIYENDGKDWLHLGIAGMVAVPDGQATGAVSNGNEARFRSRPEARSATSWVDTGAIKGAEVYEVLGLESMYNLGPVHFCGEYQFNWVQRNAGFQNVMLHGAYVQAAYFITGEHMVLERDKGALGRVTPNENFFLVDHLTGQSGTGLGAWQVAARYSYADFTDNDVLGGIGQSGTLALNWHWNAYSKLQLNAIYGRVDDHAAVGGFTAGDYWILGSRLAVDF